MIFGYETYYPAGGCNDFLTDVETEEQVDAVVKRNIDLYSDSTGTVIDELKGLEESYEWIEVLDSETRIVSRYCGEDGALSKTYPLDEGDNEFPL